MAKILLVEDDNNLREIYEARLQAEGYEIVSARDGEEALTVAMKERPDLIISDVMMPKISGFDMLDIIRSTEETKDVKVIMMTALSQAEDKARAEKLGADRYLVKSQVTLEDVAKVAREVLSGQSAPIAAVADPVIAPIPPVADVPAPAPVVAAPDPDPAPTTNTPPAEPNTTSTTDTPSVNPALSAVTATDSPTVDPVTPSPADEDTAIAAQIESFIDSKKSVETPEIPPAAPVVAEPAVTPETPSVPIAAEPAEENKDDASAASPSGKKVIQPISDPNASKEGDLNSLLEKEKEKDQMAEIAKNLATDSSGVADELSAEAALRSAARNPHTEAPVENASELKITEDGDLKVASAPSEASIAEVTSPPIDTSDVPLVAEPTVTLPATNGTNIDGVVPTTPPTTEKPADTGVDPDSIAL